MLIKPSMIPGSCWGMGQKVGPGLRTGPVVVSGREDILLRQHASGGAGIGTARAGERTEPWEIHGPSLRDGPTLGPAGKHEPRVCYSLPESCGSSHRRSSHLLLGDGREGRSSSPNWTRCGTGATGYRITASRQRRGRDGHGIRECIEPWALHGPPRSGGPTPSPAGQHEPRACYHLPEPCGLGHR